MNSKAFTAALAMSLSLALLVLGTASAAASPREHHGGRSALQVTTVLYGAKLTHSFTAGGSVTTASLGTPDDLTRLGNELFVAFQNGVGPQGEPAPDGDTASTIVAFSPGGRPSGQWDVTGKTDGLTADPNSGTVIATVNEDANSSLYVIDPLTGSVVHYRYDQNPLPHNGGTDAISVFGSRILISASAPGTPSAASPNPPGAAQPQYPAVYSVTLDPQTLIASVSPLFSDEATATAADGPTQGQPTKLALTDPDSNEVVPRSSPRFARDFVLDSQGDQQQIYVSDPGGPGHQLSVLSLDQSVDDTAWATEPGGALYATDSSANTVNAISGDFRPGTVFTSATPCSANSAPSTCTTPNFLAMLDLTSGHVSPVSLRGTVAPGGLIFVPKSLHDENDLLPRRKA
jgi:hypothetical protein